MKIASYFLSMSLLILPISPVHSGPVKVGNGGGFAEMKVLSLFQNIELYLLPCLSPQNVCELSPAEVRVTREIFAGVKAQRRHAGMGFHSENQHPFISEGGFGGPLSIHSQLLYSGSAAKPSAELGAILLEALVLKTSHPQFKGLGGKIFGDLKEDVRTARAGIYLVHVVEMHLRGSVRWALGFEDQQETLDLTPALDLSFQCESPQIFKLGHPRSHGNFVSIEVEWACRGKPSSGRVYISSDEELRLVRDLEF